MTRGRRSKWLPTRAPRKGTLIAATILYLAGLFGWLEFMPAMTPYATGLLAVAGGLLIAGALLRDL
jgi:hypothetical protein